MSELIGINNEQPMIWRVKKKSDDAIFGPVDAGTLKEWANSAQIAPQDLIDSSDDNWKPAPDIDFLDMHWLVNLPGEESYGRPRWGRCGSSSRRG